MRFPQIFRAEGVVMTTIGHKMEAVILDWAGVTVDYGSRAPTEVFIEIFRRRGIDITSAEARGPMGLAKRDHIAAIAACPRIAAQWRALHAQEPTEQDVQAMYEESLPLQKEKLACGGSEVIPGVPEAIDRLRRLGLKIGSTTGYSRDLMDVVAPLAARGGYAPDVIVCADEVRAGRPAPWMNIRAAELMGVDSMNSVVVIDDTPVGVQAGRNAGAWTVAVSQSGNELGLSLQEVAALSSNDLAIRLNEISSKFLAVGAHLVIPSVAELPDRLTELPAAAGLQK
jgi:phosphonoacetaldehyde hydrolase